MAKVSFPGLAEYERKLSQLGNKSTDEIAGKAIYAGAKIITDKIRENIDALPAVNDVEGTHAWKAGRDAPLTKKAKRGLQEGLGISPLQNSAGFINVKIGFDGYNDLKTKKYPKGQPNVLVARVTESGSSIADKHPFVRPAIRAAKAQAEEEMARVIDTEIEKFMKE